MARKMKTIIDKTCPLCKKPVSYWANCCERTAKDIYNHFYIQYRGGRKQFYHTSCFKDNSLVPKMNNTEEAK